MLPERAFSNTGEKLHLFPGVPASNWQYLCQYKRREEEFAFFIFCALRSTSSHLICIVVISFFGSISWLMEIGLYKKTRRDTPRSGVEFYPLAKLFADTISYIFFLVSIPFRYQSSAVMKKKCPHLFFELVYDVG